MWFDRADIKALPTIKVDNLHGYVLPHAGTKYTGHIISHTLRFRPTKRFSNILIIYLPSLPKPNVGRHHHEYHVPFRALQAIYPRKRFVGYNMLASSPPDISGLGKGNTLFVVSADFSHHLTLHDAIRKENCAAHALMHRALNLECTTVVDDIRSFRKMYELLPRIVMQWVGRTRSPGVRGVGYLSFLLRDPPNVDKVRPSGFFVTAYDRGMQQRECLGDTHGWSQAKERKLRDKVIRLGRTTSRLTGGAGVPADITNYTVTYLYRDKGAAFTRGWNAIMDGALYLPDVFLENTFSNGRWIQATDKVWPTGNTFSLEPTLDMLARKAGVARAPGKPSYELFQSQDKHGAVGDKHRAVGDKHRAVGDKHRAVGDKHRTRRARPRRPGTRR